MLSTTEKISRLRKSELFSGMAAEALKKIAEATQEMRFADDETIFQDGEKGDGVYFVVEGEVRIHIGEVEIARFEERGCVGEMAVIKDREEFGEERLKRLIMENIHLSPVDLKGAILQGLNDFCKDVAQTDDISLVVIKMET